MYRALGVGKYVNIKAIVLLLFIIDRMIVGCITTYAISVYHH
jgi:hypothetical protein